MATNANCQKLDLSFMFKFTDSVNVKESKYQYRSLETECISDVKIYLLK